MRTIRQVNIINRQDYFFNDITNIGDFDSNLLNMDQMAFKSNDSIIYEIKYIKNLNGSNSLYLAFNNLEIKEQIELISGNKGIKYSKDFMKIKFESDDDLPITKIINTLVCLIIIRGVFEEDSKYYPQVLLHDCFFL